ncbi:hypothetical protein ES703_125469 [subsurface metagenome]
MSILSLGWQVIQNELVDELPGVRVIQQGPRMLHLAYQGTADAILKWIAQFPVDRIATPQTSLEEVFMQYYEKQAGPTVKGGSAATARGGSS